MYITSILSKHYFKLISVIHVKYAFILWTASEDVNTGPEALLVQYLFFHFEMLHM